MKSVLIVLAAIILAVQLIGDSHGNIHSEPVEIKPLSKSFSYENTARPGDDDQLQELGISLATVLLQSVETQLALPGQCLRLPETDAVPLVCPPHESGPRPRGRDASQDGFTEIRALPLFGSSPEAWLRRAGAPAEWWDALLGIGQCESGLNPDAIGDGGSSLGWLQIQPFAGGQHLWRLGELGYPLDPQLLFDPVISARVAVHIRRDAGGWWPWSCAPTP